MTRIPVKLGKDPIIDCLIEMRFKAASDSVADILPGLLFDSFKDQYPTTQRTVQGQLPRIARDTDPNLSASPIVHFRGPSGYIGVGDTAVRIVFEHPYPGWDLVCPLAEELFTTVLQTGLLSSVERLSLRYTNIVGLSDEDFGWSDLALKFEIGGGLQPRGPGTLFRTEIQSAPNVITVVQINTGARAERKVSGQPAEVLAGTLIAVDTIFIGNIDGANELKGCLKQVHEIEKNVFFRLLTPEATEKLEPQWGAQ